MKEMVKQNAMIQSRSRTGNDNRFEVSVFFIEPKFALVYLEERFANREKERDLIGLMLNGKLILD